MGLDMYLTAKRYIDRAERMKLSVVFPKECWELLKVDPQHLEAITIEVMYWRKVNAIHAWFVKNCQEGVDDCRSAHVPRERLAQLQHEIEVVLEDKRKAGGILPTQTGFFFGGEEYDVYYFEELERTAKELKRILEDPKYGEYEFQYQSSW